MGFVTDARWTAQHFTMREAVRVEKCGPTPMLTGRNEAGERVMEYHDNPNFLVIGSCGHILACIAPRDKQSWEDRIATRRRFRKRCEHCPKDPA
jgi:hypothetical protein